MASEEEEFAEYLNEKASEFDALCAERHEAGAKEYGAVTFLGNDVVRMMLEELADTANYCRMQGVKLLMLQEHLEADLFEKENMSGFNQGGDTDNIQIGFEAFKGTKDVGWRKGKS
jgi:hypothetical protein